MYFSQEDLRDSERVSGRLSYDAKLQRMEASWLYITQQDSTRMAQKLVISSLKVAKDNKHQIAGMEHLMKALLEQKNGLTRRILSKAEVNSTRLLDATNEFIQRQPKALGEFSGSTIGRDLQALIFRAWEYKKKYGDSFLLVEHLLLGFIEDQRYGKQIFKEFQISLKTLTSAIQAIRGRQTDPKGKYEAVEKYGKDLTAVAKEGKLDPVIGRDAEIHRCIWILLKKTKEQFLLAQRIVQGDVPQAFMNSKLISLDMGVLIAGAKDPGEFEDRLKAVLKEVRDSDGQIILFIDEIHTVAGAGFTNGAMDAGNLLKPLLGCGELRCISATTLDEYRKYIEKHPALERRFQPVYVGQPTVEDTISILRVSHRRYELHHGVHISDGALVEAAIFQIVTSVDVFCPTKVSNPIRSQISISNPAFLSRLVIYTSSSYLHFSQDE
ncbi:hypothetical protein HHK36_007317 [Tetracentron sinense]|uniref:Clp R domain-containing protein n=1 Tax=Tetracentron sinense TaxID=13715 RepID=A0A834ZME2_TETSI|nr:hypothetical protein HHK36_007317 [Tetracentron sinense]